MVIIKPLDIIHQFIIGGLLVSGITFVGNNVSVKLAAIITALPLGIIPMYFFNKKVVAQNFGYDATLTNLIVFLTYISYDRAIRKYSPKKSLLIAFLTWMVLSVSLYIYWTITRSG